MRAGAEGVVTEADVRAAQVLLDTLQGLGMEPAYPGQELEVRGMIAAHLADVRTAGYLEGEQTGRRQTAHLVLDALAGEGLVPAFLAPGGDL